jgi:dTDP-4-amino-4,6-dideoxygalactose transaminase
MFSLGLKAKLGAIFAAIGLAMLAAIKVLTMQRDAARTDAKRAKKHLKEATDIQKVEKEIKKETKKVHKKAVEAIKRGEVPDNIRNRNDF